jgi:hypothetical protein
VEVGGESAGHQQVKRAGAQGVTLPGRDQFVEADGGAGPLGPRGENLANDRLHGGAVCLGAVQLRMVRSRRECRHRVVVQDGGTRLGCGVDRLQGEAAWDRAVQLVLQLRRRGRWSSDRDLDVVRCRVMEGRQEGEEQSGQEDRGEPDPHDECPHDLASTCLLCMRRCHTAHLSEFCTDAILHVRNRLS